MLKAIAPIFCICLINFSVRVCTVNFSAAWKNVDVHDRMINLALCGVHTYNNDVRGMHSVGRVQSSFVGARTMWVYVVAR
jgi:hypothetical protein